MHAFNITYHKEGICKSIHYLSIANNWIHVKYLDAQQWNETGEMEKTRKLKGQMDAKISAY